MGHRGFKTRAAKPQSIPAEKPRNNTFVPTPTLRLVRPALTLFRENFVALAIILIIPGMVSTLGQELARDFINSLTTADTATSIPDPNNAAMLGLFLTGLAAIWLFINLPVAYYVQLRAVHGATPGVVECYRNGLRFILRLYGMLALLTCLVLATAILIFPIFIFLRRYILAPYFLIDGNTGIRVAMQRSAAATKPYRRYVWEAILVMVIIGCISYGASSIATPYGALLVAPLACLPLLVFALRYRELSRQLALAVKK